MIVVGAPIVANTRQSNMVVGGTHPFVSAIGCGSDNYEPLTLAANDYSC
jgi:hypothetical protein